MKHLLGKWIELSQVEKNFEGVKELFVIEQFLNNCSHDLSIYLKEHMPLKINELVDIAGKYVDAHGGLKKIVNLFIGKRSKSTSKSAVEELKAELNKSENQSKDDRHCFVCKKPGHFSRNCRQKIKNLRKNDTDNVSNLVHNTIEGGNVQQKASCVNESQCNAIETISVAAGMPVEKGVLQNNVCVEALRDTGCSTVVVNRNLVCKDWLTGDCHWVKLADGQVKKFPVAKFAVNTPYYSGEVSAICMTTPIYDLIIGNIAGTTPLETVKPLQLSAVMTRAAVKKNKDGCSTRKIQTMTITDSINLSPEDMKRAQKEDLILSKWRYCAENNTLLSNKGNSKLILKNGLLYKIAKIQDRETEQLVLPQMLREPVMKFSHECLLGGLLGISKTTAKIKLLFAWPGMFAEINRFCLSCSRCQRMSPKGRVSKVPLENMPLIDTPFRRVAVDIVGPIRTSQQQW